MATIKKYKKKDGSTAYMFNAYLGIDPLTGKSKRTTRRGFRTSKEAKLALAQLQLEIDDGKFAKQDYSTFKQVYELWLVNYKLTVKTSSAIRITCLFENQILPKFGDKRIKKINTAFCQKIVNEWNNENAPVRLRSYTKKIFQYAISINLIANNPMDNILTPRKNHTAEKKKENFFDKNQLKNFLDIIEREESYGVYTIFRLLAYTGMRKGELAALTWNDIDFIDGKVKIEKTGYYLEGKAQITTTKTKKSQRTISLDKSTLSVLKKWKLEQKKYLLTNGIRVKRDHEQLIFSNNKNELLYNAFVNDVLRNYTEFNITPHGFRHTHASLLFEAEASIKQVQERLGHATIKTTMEIYTHVTKETEKDTATKFLNYMNL